MYCRFLTFGKQLMSKRKKFTILKILSKKCVFLEMLQHSFNPAYIVLRGFQIDESIVQIDNNKDINIFGKSGVDIGLRQCGHIG